MKLIKILSIGLCLTAFTMAASAQQQTTQKTQTSTPATGTSELKKADGQKKGSNASTLTTAERSAAARRHQSTKANGASPSLTDSKSQPARRADATRQSTGKRDNNAPSKAKSTATPRDGDTKQ